MIGMEIPYKAVPTINHHILFRSELCMTYPNWSCICYGAPKKTGQNGLAVSPLKTYGQNFIIIPDKFERQIYFQIKLQEICKKFWLSTRIESTNPDWSFRRFTPLGSFKAFPVAAPRRAARRRQAAPVMASYSSRGICPKKGTALSRKCLAFVRNQFI